VSLVVSCLHRKSVLNLNELGQMNVSAGAGGEDEEFPAPHELGEELQFTGRWEQDFIMNNTP